MRDELEFDFNLPSLSIWLQVRVFLVSILPLEPHTVPSRSIQLGIYYIHGKRRSIYLISSLDH